MCYLLENSIIPTFVSKGHVFTMWLKFLNAFHPILWELSNQTSAMDIGMQNIPNEL